MLTKENRSELLAKAQAILNEKPFSKMAEGQFHSIMRLVDAIDADRGADTRAVQASKKMEEIRGGEVNTKELRAEMEFRQFVVNPGIEETRTYSALQTGVTPGSFLVPRQWRAQYQTKLASASGWLKAGATLAQTETGRKYLSFFADDTSNVAAIVPENTAIALANPVYSQPSPDTLRFCTSTILSMELRQDAAFDIQAHLQGLFGVRVGRAFNTFASNDGTYGLFAQLTAPATSSSSSVPTLAELAQMQDPSVIDPAYLESDSQPVYMVSPAMRTRLMKQVDSQGRRLYPEIADGELLGVPLVVNVDQSSASGGVGVVFGSVKRAVLVQDVNPLLVSSAERYAEQASLYYSLTHRMGVKLVDSAAVTALKLA